MLSTKLIVIFTSTDCTLNCKLCSTGIPKYKASKYRFKAKCEQINTSLDELFRIYSYVERFDISGGEPLLWGDMELTCLLRHLTQYKDKFGSIRILTNGTLVPSEQVISVLCSLDYPVSFMIDNYGNLSPKVSEIKEVCDSNKISYKIIPYFGDDQWYGGWVDIFGTLSDKRYSHEELNALFDTCHIAHEMVLFLFDGKLYQCPTCPLIEQMNNVYDSQSFVPLINGSVSIEIKRGIAEQFGKRVPKACNYCNGFDAANAIRYMAAEQL